MFAEQFFGVSGKIFKKIKAGDEQAFELLFRKYYLRLCGFANKFLANTTDSEEFVQEVWKERLREMALEYKICPDAQRTRKFRVTSESSKGEVTFVDVVGHTTF
jgi:hypothetical protein